MRDVKEERKKQAVYKFLLNVLCHCTYIECSLTTHTMYMYIIILIMLSLAYIHIQASPLIFNQYKSY